MVKSKLALDGIDTPSYTTFTLEPTDGGTRLTWSFHANVDNLVGCYMGLAMANLVGADY